MASVYQHTLFFKGDAFSIFDVFKKEPHVFFLDSSRHQCPSLFSYIGFAPLTTYRGRDLSAFKSLFERCRLPRQAMSFPAGAVGYLGYDGSLFFGLYDTVMTFDHRACQLTISGLSKGRIKDILKRLKLYLPAPEKKAPKFAFNHVLDFKSNFSRADYLKAVRQALDHIRRGNIYQINLSHQIKVALPQWPGVTDAPGMYRQLRCAFPSEFGAYFDDGKQVILSASPERFLRLQGRQVQVKPMKGTRPRGDNKARDKALKEQLRKSPKEMAELLMVTDLERNDLGRVCEYASVKVVNMRTIETYRSVFQATSTVEGQLRKGCDQFDLLRALFPSGSVTGCPKIEAMKIIKLLEKGPRGLYTGALGYMSFSGDMDFNVMIRTMFLNQKEISFHVGGGIVADSKPQEEWQETWDKAKPLMDALREYFL